MYTDPTGHRVLKDGMTGDDVKELQKKLGVKADGIFGPKTEDALIKYQNKNGLTPDGKAGDKTKGDMGLPQDKSSSPKSPSTTPAKPGSSSQTPGTPTQKPPVTQPQPGNQNKDSKDPAGKGSSKESTKGFEQLPSSGTGYEERDGNENHSWGTPDTVNSLENLGEKWAEDNDVLLQYSDISKKDGGYLSPHASHQKGIDIDIRPVRNDGKEGTTSINDSTYSRDKTRELINDILATGDVKIIYFNDPVLIEEFKPKVKKWDGHEDHLHVRYNS